MPDRKIEIEILAKGKPAERGIDKVKQKTKDLQRTTEKSGASMTMAWAKVGASVGALVIAFNKLNQAYGTQLKAEIALGNALKINAKQGSANLDYWKQYASALQEATLFGDEVTLQQIAMLKTMGLTDEQTQKVIETAMDYATAFGKDLPSATRELTMTLSGQIGTIKRTIPSIGDFTKAQLQNGDAIAKVSELVKGQAKAIAETPYGQVEQASNSFGDQLEKLGETASKLVGDSGILTLLTGAISAVSVGFELLAKSTRFIISQAKDLLGINTELARIAEIELKSKQKIAELQNRGTEERLNDSYKMRSQLLREIYSYQATGDALSLENAYSQLAMLDKQIQSLKKFGDAHKIVRDEINERKDALNEESVIVDYINRSYQNFAKGFSDAVGKAKTDAEVMQDVGGRVAKGIEDFFVNSALNIKTSFKDLAQSVISDLIRMQVRASVVKPLANFFNIPTSHTGTTEVKHTGGYIGRLPSYHMGMRSDERVAKLQVGEAVVNRAGASLNRGAIDAMNAGYQVGGTGNVTQAEINFNVQAIDAVSFNNYLVGNKQTIENIINNSLQTNGTVRRTIKQVI